MALVLFSRPQVRHTHEIVMQSLKFIALFSVLVKLIILQCVLKPLSQAAGFTAIPPHFQFVICCLIMQCKKKIRFQIHILFATLQIM